MMAFPLYSQAEITDTACLAQEEIWPASEKVIWLRLGSTVPSCWARRHSMTAASSRVMSAWGSNKPFPLPLTTPKALSMETMGSWVSVKVRGEAPDPAKISSISRPVFCSSKAAAR